MKKVCCKCTVEKDLQDFYSNVCTKDSKTSYCKECMKKRRDEYYVKNRQTIIKKNSSGSETFRKYMVEYNKRPEARTKRRNYARRYFRERYNSDALYKMQQLMRNHVRRAFAYALLEKNTSSLELIGCDSWDTLKQYLEKQFKPGMSWDNYGHSTWHIDHIIPLCSAKTIEDVKKLSHYTNLQPLWAHENLAKRYQS